MKKPTELIHRPLGDQHPYESVADERVPRYPYPGDTVELGVLTRPIGAVQKVTVSCWMAEQPDKKEYGEFALTESVPTEAAFTEDGHLSEAAARAGIVVGVDRWRASLPVFSEGTKIYYQLSAETGDEPLVSQVYTYTVRKVISLDEVVGISQGSNTLVFSLRNSPGDGCGYLILSAAGDGHLQVEAGYGDLPEDENVQLVRFEMSEDSGFTQDMGGIGVQVDCDTFELQLFYQGNLILSGMQAPQLVLGEDEAVEAVIFSFASPLSERFFGFGERFNVLDQRGQRLDVCVYDQYKNQDLRTYIPMPLFVSSQGYGLFVESSRHSIFDLAHSDPARWSLKTEIGGQKGLSLDILLGVSTQLLEIVSRLNALTGRPVLPPAWAFGLWISSNEWNSQARVEEIIQQHEQLEIPASVVVLEAWSDENTFYIWNEARYTPKPGGEFLHYDDFDFPEDGKWPDPRGMVAKLHKKGMRLLLWQIPVLKMPETEHTQLENDIGYMLENGYCVQHEDGGPYRVRPYWFHDGYLLDFTHPQGVDWWMSKLAYLLTEVGIDGFKTDGGEHVWGHDLVFADGRGSDEIGNEYPNQYVGAYFNFARKHKSDVITFSRAGFTGAQAFPCHWAGDENSTWEAFQHSILAGLNAGISGISFWGWDIAGFSGEIPTAELYLRAAAMATFCPIMQYHSEYNFYRQPSNDRTPWNIAEYRQTPEVISIFRFYARLRMNLLPYILQTARQSALTGLPMMRAFCLAYPQDERAAEYPYQYLFGDSLLVAPIVEPGIPEVEVYLPPGDWYSFWDGKRFEGETAYDLPTSLAQIPVFLKSGHVIPLNLDDTYTIGCDVGNRTDSFEKLCFKVFPEAPGDYTWYDEHSQTEMQFFWKEISTGKYVLQIDALTCPIHILFPEGFACDRVSGEAAKDKKIISLADIGAEDIRIYFSTT